MRVVFISGCNTQQRAIINSLAQADAIDLSVVRLLPESSGSTTESISARLMRNPFKLVLKKLESWNYARRERARRAFMERRFGKQEFASLKELTLARSEVNSPAAASVISALQPDILIVCGAPILKPSIFSLAAKFAINIHFGSVPRYRGEYCLFWALLRRDYEHLEVSVHQMTSELDRGSVFIRGRPELMSDMHEFEIEARMVDFLRVELKALMVKFLGGTAAAISSPQQVSELFRLRDRTVLSDLRYYLSRRDALKLPAK